jgi:hypothetical protein
VVLFNRIFELPLSSPCYETPKNAIKKKPSKTAVGGKQNGGKKATSCDEPRWIVFQKLLGKKSGFFTPLAYVTFVILVFKAPLGLGRRPPTGHARFEGEWLVRAVRGASGGR